MDPPERIVVPDTVEIRAVPRVRSLTASTLAHGLVGALLVVAVVWATPMLLDQASLPAWVRGALLVGIWTGIGAIPGVVDQQRNTT